MTTNEPKVQEQEDGAVLYSDGGCRNDYGGCGYHGYTYSLKKPTKGSGCVSQYLTTDGYIPKVDVKNKENINEVKPINYLNGFMSIPTPTTNNVAEILGATRAIEAAYSRGVRNLSVLTDSEMVVKAANGWITNWKNNGWIKSDGGLVANKELWIGLDKQINNFVKDGKEITLKWIKGHSNHFGNERADKLATIAVLHSKENKIISELDIEPSEGYWKDCTSRNPMITHKRIYFTTGLGNVVPGEYYLGDHGKDDDLLGKRAADGAFSYVKLKEPEFVIEVFRKRQVEIAKGEDAIIMGRIDKLYTNEVYGDIIRYGKMCMYTPYRDKMDLHYVDSEPISKELKPPRLAMRAVNELSNLKGLLLVYLGAQDDSLFQTDITDVLYSIDEKSNYKLKPEYVVGFTDLKINVGYRTHEKCVKTTEDLSDDKTGCVDEIVLCMGVDLPERNYLKRLEKHKPKVIVVTWPESDKVFRYATIVKTQDDIGIWAGVFSNMKVVK